MISDFDLLDRFTDGDHGALEEIVSRYQKAVFFFILRMVWDETDAADLSQKTFINAFRNIRGFNRRSNFKTWLYRIAINVCKNHFRDDPRRRELNIEGRGGEEGVMPGLERASGKAAVYGRSQSIPRFKL